MGRRSGGLGTRGRGETGGQGRAFVQQTTAVCRAATKDGGPCAALQGRPAQKLRSVSGLVHAFRASEDTCLEHSMPCHAQTRLSGSQFNIPAVSCSDCHKRCPIQGVRRFAHVCTCKLVAHASIHFHAFTRFPRTVATQLSVPLQRPLFCTESTICEVQEAATVGLLCHILTLARCAMPSRPIEKRPQLRRKKCANTLESKGRAPLTPQQLDSIKGMVGTNMSKNAIATALDFNKSMVA